MAWTIDGKRIYVEEDTGWKVQPRQSEIDVLDSSQTIIHDAGRKSYSRSLTFVVFSGYNENIITLPTSTAVALTSDQGAEGNVIIRSIDGKRLRDISRTTAVVRVTMELTKDGE